MACLSLQRSLPFSVPMLKGGDYMKPKTTTKPKTKPKGGKKY